ncbi:MAG: FkbM family methyltransferase [Alphaproteobacteria bacterium]|nr:FkbM family methyltransferase [Alphaproteobacteria bacterium]
MPNPLSWHARLTYCAHMFKALTRQHHLELLPLLKKHIPENGVIIDVGAHAGQYTKLFARVVPQGHVYSFEPGSYARSIVSKVIALRNLKNVSLFPVGLSDQPTEETLHVPIKRSGSVGFGLSHIGQVPKDAARPEREEKIVLTTLDQVAAELGLTRVDFIKADIEGWEMRFLLGARQTISKFRPIIFLEINDEFLKRANNSAREIWDFLKAMDYRISRLEKDGATLIPLDAPVTRGDVWCQP